jgi:very-short-patch-repair endonuclease
MKTKDYYDQHIKTDPKEGICLECGKSTYFQDLGAGYPNKYCSMSCNKAEAKRQRIQGKCKKQEDRKLEHITCRICGKSIIGFVGMSGHLSVRHAISTQQYYDAYLRKSDEGTCKHCQKLTKFVSIKQGYSSYCCSSCYNASPEHRNIVSIAKSKIPSPLKGKPSPFKGVPHSYEWIKNIRIAAMKRAEEHCRLFGQTFPTRGNKEIPFMDELQLICPYRIDINFRPSGYVLDGYIHELQLAIEYDEPYHDSQIQKERDKTREQNVLKEYPKTQFFRVKESDWEKDPQAVIKSFIELVFTQEEVKQIKPVRSLLS